MDAVISDVLEGDLAKNGRLSSLSHSSAALQVLRDRFGLPDWRAPQDKVVNAILSGEHVLLHAATSFGKSICFQVPALYKFEKEGSTAIVITPLIALIVDQARHLEEKNIPVAYFHHHQSPDEVKRQIARVANREVPIVYVSPERFCSGTFRREALGIEGAEPLPISFLVIDESHLPHLWGRNFRYAYGKKLGDVIAADFPQAQIVACTATPTPESQNYLSQLVSRDSWTIFQADLHRPNLHLSIADRDPAGNLLSSHKQKLRELLRIINEEAKEDPLIVYCSTRREVEELHEELSQSGINAVYYHGEREGSDKETAQQQFMSDQVNVMVCTSAFGTGLDKPNIRRIIHFNTPGSIEQWAQEAGRAGRDGNPASCQIFFSPLDLHTHMYFARQANPKPSQLLQFFNYIWNFLDSDKKNAEVPETWINMADFLDRKKRGHFAGLNQTCLVILQNAGIIDIDAWNVRFPIHPTKGAKDGEYSAAFLECFPTKEDHAASRARLSQSLKLLMYMIQEGRRDPYSIPGLMQNHLLTNGIVDRVSTLDLRSMVEVDTTLLNQILRVVNHGDVRVSSLISQLMKSPMDDLSSGRSLDLSEYGRSGLYSLVEHACWVGLLRLHTRGMTNFVSLTPSGVTALSEISTLSEAERQLLEPSDTYEKLRLRLGHASERETLRMSLHGWYNDLATQGYDHASVMQSVDGFGTTDFTILGKLVRGDDLVKGYVKGSASTNIVSSDRLNLLIYLFPEIIREKGNFLPLYEVETDVLDPDPSLEELSAEES